MSDLKFAFRQLLKNPGFTAVAVLTLMLGIGATTAIFSVVYAVVLRPLPFPESERLVAIWTQTPQVDRLPMAAANHRDLKSQGTVVWNSGPNPGAYSTPVPFKTGEQPALAILGPASVFAVNAETGKELWRHPWPTPYGISIADPIVSGDKVFVSSSYGKGAGLIQIRDGKASQVWANLNMINHFNSCVLIEGHRHRVNCDTKRIAEGNLRCIHFKTGQVKWTHEGTGAGTQMAVGNKLVVLTGAGELIVAEATPSEFRPLARAQVLGGRCWTVPVFANGRLYCRNLQGTLVCLDVKSRTTARRYECRRKSQIRMTKGNGEMG